MSELVDTILKCVKTWRNTLKLSKWHKEVHWQSYSLDRFDERAVKKPIRLRDYLCPLRIEDCKWTCIFHVHRNLFKISIHLLSFLSNLILNFLYIPTSILHAGALPQIFLMPIHKWNFFVRAAVFCNVNYSVKI